ncbi:MAG: glucokinase [Steroidobacteraceae bacterium]
MILVGDIGGTRTRFALAERQGSDWRFSRLEDQPTMTGVATAVTTYLQEAGVPGLEAAAFCGAGPLAPDGRIRLTNADVLLDPAALARAAGVERATLINDFAAVAHGIPRMPAAAFLPCGGGTAAPDAARVVLGPGTGLGIATLAPAGAGWIVIPGEAHADLAPVDDEELDAWKRLRQAHGRVSLETVLCGPGLVRLHAVLARNPAASAAEIAEAAWRGEADAVRVVALFTRWLGRVAGNMALTGGARGGVYLAGGILPAWSSRFDTQSFRQGFEDKAPLADWLRRVPGFLVQYPQPGLFGLAVIAAGESDGG